MVSRTCIALLLAAVVLTADAQFLSRRLFQETDTADDSYLSPPPSPSSSPPPSPDSPPPSPYSPPPSPYSPPPGPDRPPPSPPSPPANVTPPSCTPLFPGAVYTPFDSCYCSCPTAFVAANASADGSTTVNLPSASFSISGPDPLFGYPPASISLETPEISTGGRRLLADSASLLPSDVLPVLAGVLQGGQVNGLNVPRWMIDDVLLSLGITRRNSPLPPTLLSGLESVLGGAASAGSQVSSDVVSAIQTVLRAALPSGITQIADQGGLPLQEQIQNAADTLTQDDNQLPQPPKPTSDDITNAVKAILAVQGVRTLTDPNALPTVIANAVTLVNDPKAAVQNVPQDLLNAVKTILSIPQQAASDAASTVNAFFSQLNFPGKLLPTPNDIAQVAVNKLVDTIRNRPAPFINLIQAGLSEDLVNALKFGIPANATIFGGDFSGIPALPGPISSALQILLSSKIKIATLQSADSLVRDFFQRIQQNGVDIKQDPITLDGFFSALQIFEALAIDQSLPFDLINALQVFLNITVPEPLAKLAATPEGLLPALPGNLVSQLQNFFTSPIQNAIANGAFSFSIDPITVDNVFSLSAMLSGILPAELEDTPLGAGLIDFLNTTVDVPARFVANATRNALPPPPPPPQFPGFNLSGPGSPLAEGPLGVARGVMPQGTAGPLTVFDPLPNALVNGLQNLMLPGSLPQGLDPIPDPVSSSVRTLTNFIIPGAIPNNATNSISGNLFDPDCTEGTETNLEQCYCTCALVFD